MCFLNFNSHVYAIASDGCFHLGWGGVSFELPVRRLKDLGLNFTTQPRCPPVEYPDRSHQFRVDTASTLILFDKQPESS